MTVNPLCLFFILSISRERTDLDVAGDTRFLTSMSCRTLVARDLPRRNPRRSADGRLASDPRAPSRLHEGVTITTRSFGQQHTRARPTRSDTLHHCAMSEPLRGVPEVLETLAKYVGGIRTSTSGRGSIVSSLSNSGCSLVQRSMRCGLRLVLCETERPRKAVVLHRSVA
jgi:hypothetical protein